MISRISFYNIFNPIPGLRTVSRGIAGLTIRYNPNGLGKRARVAVVSGVSGAGSCTFDQLYAVIKRIESKLPTTNAVRLTFPADAGKVEEYFLRLAKTGISLKEANEAADVQLRNEVSTVPRPNYNDDDPEI